MKLCSRQLCWQGASSDDWHFGITQYGFLLAHASVVVCNVMCNIIKSFSRQTQYLWLVLSFAQEAVRLFEEEKRLSWHYLICGGVCNLACSCLFEKLTFIYLLHVYSLFPLRLMDIKVRVVYVSLEVIWSKPPNSARLPTPNTASSPPATHQGHSLTQWGHSQLLKMVSWQF